MRSRGDPPARGCGDCSLCCKLLGIEALGKPLDKWCSHCAPGAGGCTIYPGRPEACRSFSCLWLLDGMLGEDWRPDRAGFVLYLDEGGRRLVVHADPDRPEAWRQTPYGDELTRWAAAAGPGFRLAVLASGVAKPLG
jgi:hypothetical protein